MGPVLTRSLKTVQDTRSVLRRYTSEFENRVQRDSRVGIVIDGEACEIHCVLVAVSLLQNDNLV